MGRPITDRKGSHYGSYVLPSGTLYLEHNWLTYRQWIVFAGSLLCLIYGLIIMIAIKSFQFSPEISDPLFRNKLDNDFNIGVYIVINASFGCLSVLIKRNFSKCLDSFVNPLDPKVETQNESAIEIISFNEEPETLFGIIIEYLKKKLNKLKNGFKMSPMFALNALFIVFLMPFEFSVTRSGFQLMLKNYPKIGTTYQNMNLVLNLCLTVLFASVILIQFCIFLYICDLINTYITYESYQESLQKRQHFNTNRSESPLNYWRIKILSFQRRKNILFHQFMNRHQKSEKCAPNPVVDNKPRTVSAVSTVAAAEALQAETFRRYSFDHYFGPKV